MKNKITILSGFLFFVTLFNTPIFSQITISEDDFSKQYAFGNKLYSQLDNTTAMVNIGNTGSSSWDFSQLKGDDSYIYDVVSPVNTSYRPDFPKSQYAYKIEIPENAEPDWEYYCYSATWMHLHGLVTSVKSMPGQIIKTIYDPVKIYAIKPMTYNSTWKDSVNEITRVEHNGTLISTTNTDVITKAIIDAYGPLTLPGGVTVDALRAKLTEKRVVDNSTQYKTIYQWYTKNGETIVLSTDTSSANHGIVNVNGSIKWITTSPVTSVKKDNKIPEKFELNQNYPNPFNPTTYITYSIPENTHVEIRVFSTIGKEVATLVDENKSAGVYTTSFNGGGLTSGIYFVKMTAGNFNQVMKMTMVK